jgi:hypothetical protein
MRAILIIAIAFALATPANGDPGTASNASHAIKESKRKDILRYMELTRFEEVMRQSMQPTKQQLFQTMLRRNPQIERADKDLVNRIFEQAFETGFGEYQQRIVPLYDKYYTEDELEAAIDQLETPEGQAWMEHQPSLQGDVADLTLKWSVALSKQVGRQLRQALREENEGDAL